MRAMASLASSPACLLAAMPSDAAFCSERRRSAAAVASRQAASSSVSSSTRSASSGERRASAARTASGSRRMSLRSSTAPGRYLLPAYLERKAATSSASFPTTMFSGMIAPEKPPLRSA